MHFRMTVFDCVVISRKIACSAACLSPTEPAHTIKRSVLVYPVTCSFPENLIFFCRNHPEIIRNSISIFSNLYAAILEKNFKIAAVNSSKVA